MIPARLTAIVVAGMIAGLAAVPAYAQLSSVTSPSSSEPAQPRRELRRIITVSGEGVVQGTPDIASIVVGVVSSGETAQAAVTANSTSMAAVVDSFKEAGIESRDIATSGFSVQPRYVYPKNGGNEAPRINGYEARNSVTVRVRDLSKLGAILDKAVSTGSNQINGIAFDVAEDTPLLDKARTLAVQDAHRKAELMATAAGAKLGRVLTIDSRQGGHPGPRPMMLQAARSADAFAAKAVPVEAGEQDFRADVNVSWELVD